MTSRREKLIYKQISKAIKSPDVNLIFMPNNDDLSICYVLVRNLQSDIYPEWEGGVYLLKIIMGDTFPMQPPKFYLYTPNGVYKTGTTALCISIGHFHAENWRPVLGLIGFAKEIANGMMNREFLIELGGLGLVTSTPKEIKSLAQSSLQSIASEHGKLLDEMTDYYKEYSAKWDFSKTDQQDLEKLKFRGVVPGLKKSVSTSEKTSSCVTVAGITSMTGGTLKCDGPNDYCKKCGTPKDKTIIIKNDIIVKIYVKLDIEWVIENTVKKTIENVEEVLGKVTTNKIISTTIVTSKLIDKPTKESTETTGEVAPPAYEPQSSSAVVMSICDECEKTYEHRIIGQDDVEVINTFLRKMTFINTIIENIVTKTVDNATDVIKYTQSLSVEEL